MFAGKTGIAGFAGVHVPSQMRLEDGGDDIGQPQVLVAGNASAAEKRCHGPAVDGAVESQLSDSWGSESGVGEAEITKPCEMWIRLSGCSVNRLRHSSASTWRPLTQVHPCISKRSATKTRYMSHSPIVGCAVPTMRRADRAVYRVGG